MGEEIKYVIACGRRGSLDEPIAYVDDSRPIVRRGDDYCADARGETDHLGGRIPVPSLSRVRYNPDRGY
jgi:hypothetical protein